MPRCVCCCGATNERTLATRKRGFGEFAFVSVCANTWYQARERRSDRDVLAGKKEIGKGGHLEGVHKGHGWAAGDSELSWVA